MCLSSPSASWGNSDRPSFCLASFWGAADEPLKDKETRAPRCLAVFSQQAGGCAPAWMGVSLALEKEKEGSLLQTAQCTVYLLFSFCRKLRSSLQKDQYRGPQEGWAQALVAETGTAVWRKRLMPSRRLCPAKCSLLYLRKALWRTSRTAWLGSGGEGQDYPPMLPAQGTDTFVYSAFRTSRI